MTKEKNRRTSEEVTEDMLIKRLSNSQLAELVGNRKFKRYQQKLLDKLQPVEGLGLEGFRRVHSSNDCEIETVVTEFDVRTRSIDIDFGAIHGKVPLKKLVCTEHDVSSITFIDNAGIEQGGSFWQYREQRQEQKRLVS